MHDFVDLSQVSTRKDRYREYDRLRQLAELETAMMLASEGTSPLFTRRSVIDFIQKEKTAVSGRLPYDPELGL